MDTGAQVFVVTTTRAHLLLMAVDGKVKLIVKFLVMAKVKLLFSPAGRVNRGSSSLGYDLPCFVQGMLDQLVHVKVQV